MHKYLIVIFLAFIFSFCKNQTPQLQATEKPFFDVTGYFKNEIQRLKKDVKSIKKTVTVNGKSEEKVLTNINFDEELSPFIASDINRPAWFGKYLIKKTPYNQTGLKLEYYALQDILKTRNLIVDIPSENSYVVDILNEEKTAVTDAISLLKYNSNEGYSISKKQELIGSVDSTKVEVVFIKN